MRLTLGLRLFEIGGNYSTLFGSALIEYLSKGGKFVFSSNKLVNQGKGGVAYDAQPKTGRALQLGATNELAIPIFHTLGADTKQDATLGTGWVANGSHSYTGSTTSSSLSNISTLTLTGSETLEINFEITARTAGTVEGKSALGTYKVYKTVETLTGASFSGTVIINKVKQITNPNSFLTYHDVGTNTMVQVDCSTLPPNKTCSFLNKTVNNILTTHTAFSASDLTKLQTNPNILAKIALNGSAAELDMVLTGDEGWYACSEEAGPLAFNAKSKSNGSFYFRSSKATTQTYTLRMPVGTSVTLNGVVYNGNGNTNVTATTVGQGVKFTESVDGALTYFSGSSNNLTGSIPNLSANTALTQVYVHTNQLTGSIPDLSANTALTQFYVHTNQLTGSIPDLSANTALTQFYVHTNQLTGSIPDLSANTTLFYFYCNTNQLTGSIPDLSANTVLNQFYVHTNQLTGSIPNLSANTSLAHFYCSNNQLTGYDGGNIKVTGQFNANNNALTVAAVDSILQGLVDGGTTGSGVNIALNGGTNGIPTNTAAIDTLRARGCTVTVNT